jgi:hypothetical protein
MTLKLEHGANRGSIMLGKLQGKLNIGPGQNVAGAALYERSLGELSTGGQVCAPGLPPNVWINWWTRLSTSDRVAR